MYKHLGDKRKYISCVPRTECSIPWYVLTEIYEWKNEYLVTK